MYVCFWHSIALQNSCCSIFHCAAFCLPVGTFFKKALREILQLLVLGAKHLISHYIKKSFHPILDFRKLSIFLYRINYHLLTINAIIPSLLQHDLFYEIHRWVILSGEISFLFLLRQWLLKHFVPAFAIAPVSLARYMLLSSGVCVNFRKCYHNSAEDQGLRRICSAAHLPVFLCTAPTNSCSYSFP